ncbi:PspC domain-containing protein [Bacteroidota bacterium]
MIPDKQNRFLSLFEFQIFGVCSWFGNKLGMKATRIRLYFIYLSFFTFGSPVVLYLIGSFILEHKEYFKLGFYSKRKSVWDL